MVGQVGKGPGSGDDDRAFELGEEGRKVGDRIAGAKFARMGGGEVECSAGALEPAGIGPGASEEPAGVGGIVRVEWAPIEANPSRDRRWSYRRIAPKNFAVDADRTVSRTECAAVAIVDPAVGECQRQACAGTDIDQRGRLVCCHGRQCRSEHGDPPNLVGLGSACFEDRYELVPTV